MKRTLFRVSNFDIVRYYEDLVASFNIDCSLEDVKTDKDARRCNKVLKKLSTVVSLIVKSLERLSR